MVSVRINGSESGIDSAGLQKLTELVELIKTSIDPEHMITRILVDGRDISEQEWSAGLNQFGTAIIEVETNTPESFVTDRMSRAADIVGSCYLEFRNARKQFQAGDMVQGNQGLIKAVNTTKAFFDWYGTIVQLVSPEKAARFDITTQVADIADCCKRICQQQLYQSWWALGETLEKELEPKLDKLEDFCRRFAHQS